MVKKKWMFLSNHGLIYIYLAKHPKVTTQSLAYKVGLSIRAVQVILDDLEEDGYLSREKVGRSNRYDVNLDKHLRHRLERKISTGNLLQVFRVDKRNNESDKSTNVNRQQSLKC